jgi:methyl-accepting chemotaxis protein
MTPEEQQKINEELADAVNKINKLVKETVAAAEAAAKAAAAQNKNSDGA